MKTGSHPGIRRNTPGTAFVALELYTRHGRHPRYRLHVVSQHLSQPPVFLSQHLVSQHLFWCLNTCYLTQKSVSMLNQHPCNYLHARVWSITSSVSNDFVGTSLGGSYVHACPLPSSSSSVADTEWPRAILRRSIHRLATIHPPPAASRSNTKSTLLARAPKPASEWSPISTCISASRNGTS